MSSLATLDLDCDSVAVTRDWDESFWTVCLEGAKWRTSVPKAVRDLVMQVWFPSLERQELVPAGSYCSTSSKNSWCSARNWVVHFLLCCKNLKAEVMNGCIKCLCNYIVIDPEAWEISALSLLVVSEASWTCTSVWTSPAWSQDTVNGSSPACTITPTFRVVHLIPFTGSEFS